MLAAMALLGQPIVPLASPLKPVTAEVKVVQKVIIPPPIFFPAPSLHPGASTQLSVVPSIGSIDKETSADRKFAINFLASGSENRVQGSQTVTTLQSPPSLPSTETTALPLPSNTTPLPAVVPTNSPSTHDIFEQVFGGNQNLSSHQVVVPLVLDGQTVGQVLVSVPGGNQSEVLIAADQFLSAVRKAMRADVMEQLAAVIRPDGTLDLQHVRQVGIAINFDSSRLELQAEIPPALRATTVLSVDGVEVPPALEQALQPSRVSGYLNFQGSQEVVWSGDAADTGRQPLLLNFEGALNLNRWVLEGNFSFTEEDSPAWQRGPLRLVHDDINSSIRYQLGDFVVPVRGYQTSIPVLGFSMVRNFALQPYQVTRPISRFEFFLERPSSVEVFLNGQLLQTLRLEAGSQDVRNLSLNAGINGVQLVITDDLGRVERLDFATGVSGDLLAPGVQQFAYSLGIPARGDSPSVAPDEYDWNLPTLTLSHRVGVTDTLTLGGYLQGDITTQMAGLEGTWATTIGNFSWDAALSLDQDYGLDVAARFYYDWLFQGASSNNRSLRLSAEYRGPNFMTIEDEEPNNTTGLDLSLAYSQTIFDNTHLTISGRYQFTRDQPSDAYSIALGISQPLGSGMMLNTSASYGQNAQGETESRMFVGLSMSLTQQRQSINTSTTLDNEGVINRLNWSYDPRTTFGGLGTAFTATAAASDINLLSQIRYRGYRADLTLNHEIDIPYEASALTTQATRLTWGTALVFADGVWGWSRPVDNSFAIFARQGTAQNEVVEINPSLNGPLAQADALGPAVVPISPYALTSLSVNAPSLPAGSDLGPNSYTLFPSYRSGTLIRVGSEAVR
ncbi:fimbria/pilus outer membrane usher protein [Leptolyngbya sp. PL-A3]|uniref:fimbria/pilus outer membrane usher protein n=1 Tax=Leptolyngbya sp. PL-A3 TaxID=2933911 RepID=UPI003296DBED